VSVIAALVSLLINRIYLRLGNLDLESTAALTWARGGAFSRNLAVCACLLLVHLAIFRIYRQQHFAPFSRRFILLFFSVILILSAGAALVMHQSAVRPRLILLAMGSGNILGVLIGIEALRGPGQKWVRFGALLWIGGLLGSFLSLLLGILLVNPGVQHDLIIARTMRHVAEAMFLLSPIALTAQRALRTRSTLPIALGLLSSFITLGLLGWLFVGPSSEFALMLYGSLRTAWLLDSAPWIYLIAVPCFVGLATLCASSPETGTRRIGMGLLLSISAGFAPTSTAGALWLAAGTIFVTLGIIHDRPVAALSSEQNPSSGPDSDSASV